MSFFDTDIGGALILTILIFIIALVAGLTNDPRSLWKKREKR